MPQQIPIQAVPNQSFSVIIDDNRWDIQIKCVNGIIALSFTLNGSDVIDNITAAAAEKIIPSMYEEAGNFIFATQNFDLPNYTLFGISQTLVYFSAAELVVLRQPPPAKITAAFFNPIAALPLRFAPQGYVLAP